MRRGLLGPIWASVLLALVEAGVLLFVIENPAQLGDLGVVTAGTIMFGVSAEEVGRRRQRRFESLALLGILGTLISFFFLVIFVGKREVTGEAHWIWAELGTMLVMALTSYVLVGFIRGRSA